MNPNYCRPATGTRSENCRLGTRTKMSSIYRARTEHDLPDSSQYGDSSHPQCKMGVVQ